MAGPFSFNGAAGVTPDVQAAIDAAIASIEDGAPGALDTLNELAAALNDDANFATTVMTLISAKVSKAGDTMTGALNISYNSAGAAQLTVTSTANASSSVGQIETVAVSPAAGVIPYQAIGTGMLGGSGTFISVVSEKITPAANNLIGGIIGRALDSALVRQIYGNFTFRAAVVTAAAHTGHFELALREAAASRVVLVSHPTSGLSVGGAGVDALAVAPSIRATRIFSLRQYTVATLPAGVVGDRAAVTNALAPAFNVVAAGGGAINIPVYFNGAAWVTV